MSKATPSGKSRPSSVRSAMSIVTTTLEPRPSSVRSGMALGLGVPHDGQLLLTINPHAAPLGLGMVLDGAISRSAKIPQRASAGEFHMNSSRNVNSHFHFLHPCPP